MTKNVDLLIIGGGINGTAIARDAAGRGLSVMLCERDDLASHTSSASTKLIHGGLRYLEYMEFGLVRKALVEREVLLRAAPHIIWPMRFILPYDKGLRPAWMLRIGLFLYDRMGGRKILPGTKVKRFNTPDLKGVLESRLKFGYEYSDCWVEDSRLVALNAVDAKERGTDIRTQCEVTAIEPIDKGYRATLSSGGQTEEITAKSIVNAAGPWVDNVMLKLIPGNTDTAVRLVKGSHIVTPRVYSGDHAYIFQNADNRIIFAIPYEQDFTLIGTTDVPYDFSEGPVKISEDEVQYLCDAASEYLESDIAPKDVVWAYSGVRPLYDDKSADASAVTRDYVLTLNDVSNDAPFLSVYGGKITTSRKLAEHAIEKLEPYFDTLGTSWTKDAALPGGNIPDADFESYFAGLVKAYPWMSRRMLRRMARAYGTRCERILKNCRQRQDLGETFDGQISAKEIDYLFANEFVSGAEDVLWRRSKLGLHMNPAEQDRMRDWIVNAYKK